MARLSGRVAIITGAASGIGKEIARRFGAEGAKVVIADLELPAAQATADEIRRTGGVAMGVAMDVSDERRPSKRALPPPSPIDSDRTASRRAADIPRASRTTQSVICQRQ